jgi:molecular chaperone DnaJ
MASKRDYYEILGVPRDADEAAIKKSYRKLALDNHPDRNPGDPQAEQRFKDAAEAYSVLGDKDKRARYDQYGHAGVDGQVGSGFGSVEDVFAAFGEVFGGRGGFFEQFFGGRGGRGRRGASLRIDLQLTLEEVATGCKKTIDVKRPDPCQPCSGTGARPGTGKTRCKTCGGHGEVMHSQGFFAVRGPCPECRGAGEIVTDPCPKCRGRGMVPKTVPITIQIPPAIEEGHVERVLGQGEPGDHGGPPGDLVVVIHVEPHPLFIRAGDDLLTQGRISFRQAVLGADLELPTITGETVVLKVPAGTQPGERLRVRNHGLPRGDGYGRGNLVVQMQVDVPRKVTPEQEKLLDQFDEIEEGRRKKGGKKTIFEKVKDIFS